MYSCVSMYGPALKKEMFGIFLKIYRYIIYLTLTDGVYNVNNVKQTETRMAA